VVRRYSRNFHEYDLAAAGYAGERQCQGLTNPKQVGERFLLKFSRSLGSVDSSRAQTAQAVGREQSCLVAKPSLWRKQVGRKAVDGQRKVQGSQFDVRLLEVGPSDHSATRSALLQRVLERFLERGQQRLPEWVDLCEAADVPFAALQP